MEEIGSNDSITVVIDDDGVVVARGDVDLAGGPVLEQAILRREASGPVTIDLSGVDFIDSSGLRSLLAASRRALERGSEVVLRSPSVGVNRLLTLTGTAEQFRVLDGGN
ncbi:MAG: STAS domain-containing protein [Acidimicrobiia bacterium]